MRAASLRQLPFRLGRDSYIGSEIKRGFQGGQQTQQVETCNASGRRM
jgi:hypothetical protein